MLKLNTFPFRNLLHYWRSNLPVLLGALIGSAVLTGALLVGDSLRGSLKAKAARQLNGIQSAWIGSQFIRQSIATYTSDEPAIILQGTFESNDRRANRITIVGLPRKRNFFATLKFNEGASVSSMLAERLNLKVGDEFRVSFEKATRIPRSSLLGSRTTSDTLMSIRMKIDEIIPIADPANDFSPAPNPGIPQIVYMPIEQLQQRLSQPEKCNAILSAGEKNNVIKELNLEDWGLLLRTERVQPQGRKIKSRDLPYLSLESDRLVLNESIERKAIEAAKELNLQSSRTSTYLGISISANGKEIPYSIVASIDDELKEKEIKLLDWPQSPLKNLAAGQAISLKTFKPEIENGYVEQTTEFALKGYVPFTGTALDPSLTPPFKGITDKLSVRDWKPPFPYDNSKIKPNDIHEEFWQDYRTTPKAYISRVDAEKLFGSRFGNSTSLRIFPNNDNTNLPSTIETTTATAEQFREKLLSKLDAKEAGFQFENLAERMRAAGKGGQDFGGLFLGFSFFLIVAALLLIGLLFRLAMEQRAKPIGLLLANGYSSKQILKLLLIEGGIIATVGSLLGVFLAIPYAGKLLQILTSLWPDRTIETFLQLHVTPLSLIIGLIAGLLTALIAMYFAVRSLMKVSPPALLRGVTDFSSTSNQTTGIFSIATIGLLATSAVILIILGPMISNPDAKAGCFFGSGICLLTAGILLIRRKFYSQPATTQKILSTLPQLAKQNASRNVNRSLLTISLVAIASFLLIAVECFRRPTPSSTWQGFTHIAEVDSPLFQDFTTEEGKEDLLTNLEKRYAEVPSVQTASARRDAAAKRLQELEIVMLRKSAGDDASCLNLYQAGKPSVIGMPDSAFQKLFPLPTTQDASKVNAIVEQNTMMWMLKKSIGSQVDLPIGGQATLAKAVIDSPFQSEIIIKESDYRKIAPQAEGYKLFLLKIKSGEDISDLLELGYSAQGMTVVPIRDKIAGFQAVIGSYLTLFQLLGAFGLLLGVAGLAVVLIRSVWERSSELALLQALGFSKSNLVRLVILENSYLLILGLLVGIISAIAAVLPHLFSGGQLPWLRLTIMLVAFLVAGLLATIFASLFALRRPVISGLRSE